jgi:hypothetical protein
MKRPQKLTSAKAAEAQAQLSFDHLMNNGCEIFFYLTYVAKKKDSPDK